MPIRPRTANTCIRRCVSSYHRRSWTAGEPSGNAPQLHILLASIANRRVAEGVSVTTRHPRASHVSRAHESGSPGQRSLPLPGRQQAQGHVHYIHPAPPMGNVPSAAVCCSPLLVIVLVLHVHARRLVPA
jgi:hypothetical protein